MTEITVKQLIEAGMHFGHQTDRWNPKMERYIPTERNGIHTIDSDHIPTLTEAYS